MAGAPLGNTNARKGTAWRDALRKALAMYEDKDRGVKRGQALRKVAEQVVKDALDGYKDAWMEIGNRLDGKPHQSVGISTLDTPVEDMSDDELIAIVAEYSRRGIADSEGSTSESAELH